MNRIHAFWMVIIPLFMAVVYFGTTDATTQQTKKNFGLYSENKKDYPIVEFQSSRPSLSGEDEQIRLRKGKPYDGQRLVSASPNLRDSAVEIIKEEQMAPLPTDESDLIVTGSVTSKSAFLSNDNKGIYSEFDVRVSETLKSNETDGSNSKRKIITVDRAGGTVSYPNGQTIVYFYEGLDLPHVGKEYLFFLTADKVSPNFHIIRAYELGKEEFIPVDYPLNLEYEGIFSARTSDLLAVLRQKLLRKNPTREVR